MKKILLVLSLFVSVGAQAQVGLENVIVERYYVSDGNDTIANADGGVLPVGSVTYRIYLDMLPGYKFQAAFGLPGQEMRIETTSLFFNNEDRGATSPTYSKTQAKGNTVMLDSWLSVGGACTGQMGVLKADDDGVATVVNSYSPQVLQNADPLAGIAISLEDGMVAGTPEPVTFVGISQEVAVFDNQNDGTNGPVFATSNGSWASLNGSEGPLANNRLLIAQITTDGVLTFKLNVQLGTPTGGAEQYVADSATTGQFLFPGLNFSSASGVGFAENFSNGSSLDFAVFPNPSQDFIKLEIKPTEVSLNNSYTIYSITGTKVLSSNLGTLSNNTVETIDISSLSAGQYLLELNMDGITSAKKFVKK